MLYGGGGSRIGELGEVVFDPSGGDGNVCTSSPLSLMLTVMMMVGYEATVAALG